MGRSYFAKPSIQMFTRVLAAFLFVALAQVASAQHIAGQLDTARVTF